jgi:hypothetical protein
MIKRTLVEIREIADREQKQHHPNGTPNTPSSNIYYKFIINLFIVDQRAKIKMSRKEKILKP